MPDKAIVINTGPIIALIAATGNLNVLKARYEKVFVTLCHVNTTLAGPSLDLFPHIFKIKSLRS